MPGPRSVPRSRLLLAEMFTVAENQDRLLAPRVPLFVVRFPLLVPVIVHLPALLPVHLLDHLFAVVLDPLFVVFLDLLFVVLLDLLLVFVVLLVLLLVSVALLNLLPVPLMELDHLLSVMVFGAV